MILMLKERVPQYGSYKNTGDDDHAIVGVAQITAVTGLIKRKINFPYTAYANKVLVKNIQSYASTYL